MRTACSFRCRSRIQRLRSDLFAKSAAAFEEINRDGQAAVTWLQTPNEPVENAIATFRHIAQHLFDNPRTAPKLNTATGLEIVEAAGPTGEARVIAERVRALLLEGVSADQIVIAVRGGDDRSDHFAGDAGSRWNSVRRHGAIALCENAGCPCDALRAAE